jgi:hypothetical protein
MTDEEILKEAGKAMVAKDCDKAIQLTDRMKNKSIAAKASLLIIEHQWTARKRWTDKKIQDLIQENNRLIKLIAALLKHLKEGEDIISGLEAEADNAGVDMLEARDWWRDSEPLIEKAEREVS